VIGVEGFHLSDDQVRPEMDAILDLSDLENAAESVIEARTFVAAVATHVDAFEFTLAASARAES
jgi:hypothetical protein